MQRHGRARAANLFRRPRRSSAWRIGRRGDVGPLASAREGDASALARDGDTCPRCGLQDQGVLRVQRGIELGHCFKLGTRYTGRTNITFNDADGQEKPMVMGSYGIGVGRLMAAIVETHHDDHGIIWPANVAPYAVHMVVLAKEGDNIQNGQMRSP